VSEVYYAAYEKMAENVLSKIEDEVLTKWHAKRFVAIHRISKLLNEISELQKTDQLHGKQQLFQLHLKPRMQEDQK
jgi:hypothetical protein